MKFESEEEYRRWQLLLSRDPVLYHLERSGCSFLDMMEELTDYRQKLLIKVLEMDAICPRKYRLPDGTVKVWHCPEELIPLTDLTDLGEEK